MSRRRRDPRPRATDGPVEAVAPREPCPCGSGKRYKNCHGRAAKADAARRVSRPFEGLAGETDLVAMREIVPAATMPVQLREDDRQVTLCTVLPFGAAALVREDGSVLVAMQTPTSSGDASRDVAAGLERALAAEPGSAVRLDGLPGDGARLQDLLEPDDEPVVQVHADFSFWAEGEDAADAALASYIDQAGAAAVPTVRLSSVPAAYLSTMGDVGYLRWILPEDESALLEGLARLRASGEDAVGGQTKLLGAFRADGLLVPVWETPAEMTASDLEAPVSAVAERLAAAMDVQEPLTAAERSARSALLNRQITLTR